MCAETINLYCFSSATLRPPTLTQYCIVKVDVQATIVPSIQFSPFTSTDVAVLALNFAQAECTDIVHHAVCSAFFLGAPIGTFPAEVSVAILEVCD